MLVLAMMQGNWRHDGIANSVLFDFETDLWYWNKVLMVWLYFASDCQSPCLQWFPKGSVVMVALKDLTAGK